MFVGSGKREVAYLETDFSLLFSLNVIATDGFTGVGGGAVKTRFGLGWVSYRTHLVLSSHTQKGH